jgi:hypothetical protein
MKTLVILFQKLSLPLCLCAIVVTASHANAQTSTNTPRINDRFPLTNSNELSPPLVGSPIHECAQAVIVSGFVPFATLRVYAGGTHLVGHLDNAWLGPLGEGAVVQLTRPLVRNEKITATQTVGNLTSVHSYVPVLVTAYDVTTLPMPVVSHTIYDCGRIVPVNQLEPSAYVTVFDAGNPIGHDETTGTFDPIFISPLVAGHMITAQQVACPNDPQLKLTGPMSAAVRVLPSPNPVRPPTSDPVIPGNDSVNLHNLYVGAYVEVTDHGNVIGSGFATAKDNYCKVSPPVSANPVIQARQKLCTESKLSAPQTNIATLNRLTILAPICDDSQFVTISGSQVDATVVLERNGSIIGYGGAVVGDLELAVGGGIVLHTGDTLTAYQYAGSTVSPASSAVVVGGCSDVTTYHNNNERTGLNPNEKILTPANVKVSSFGLLFSQPVDGQVYGQPLYLSQVNIPNNGMRNVVFVITEHDSVYAFDADSNAGINASFLWQDPFVKTPNIVTVAAPGDTGSATCQWLPCDDINPEIGITGTPVIDQQSLTLYVVSKTKETSGGHTHFVQKLHALDVRSGTEKFGGPAVIADTICDNPAVDQYEYVSGPVVPGSGESNEGNNTVFYNALRQANRSGLALINDVVYVPSASHCDCPPYHGWLLGFDARTLKPLSVFITTPNARSSDQAHLAAGGIWGAGDAPAADSENSLYFPTGNGLFDTTMTANGFPILGNFGDSILKVVLDHSSSPTQPNQNGWGVKVADFFTPHNQDNLWTSDTDLGSGGVVVLPDQRSAPRHLLVQAGKEGTIYLIDRDNLGKFNVGNDNQIVQPIPGAIGGAWCTPAFFNDTLYYNGSSDVLKAFRLSNGKFSTTPVAKATTQFGSSATPSVSGAGEEAIAWTLQTDQNGKGPPILHAYRADNLMELYNSAMAARHRDQPPGNAIKFTVPTVVNGKVYIGTSDHVVVYGLLH